MTPRSFRETRGLTLQKVADAMSASLGRPVYRSDVLRWERSQRIADELVPAFLDALGAAGEEREALALSLVGPNTRTELGLATEAA
jgi:hypothetical protein